MSSRREAIDELPGVYRRACRLASQGKFDDARRLYAGVDTTSDPCLKSLVANDYRIRTIVNGIAESKAFQFRGVAR